MPSNELSPVHKLFVPAGLDAESILGCDLARYTDYARFIVHRVAWWQAKDSRYKGNAFVPIARNAMESFFTRRDVYSAVRDRVLESGVLECDGISFKNVKSYGYRMGDGWQNRRLEVVTVNDRYLNDKLARKQAEWRTPNSRKYPELFRWMTKVEINYQEAIHTLCDEKPEDLLAREIGVRMIREKDWHWTVCKYGRVHSNLTNLASCVRKHLRYSGFPLVNLDIRNSQPLLFSIILNDHYKDVPTPPDVSRYIRLTESGKFYDHMMEANGIPPCKRQEFKAAFFGGVFFCQNHPETRAAQQFRETFPNVASITRAMKSPNYANLAQTLQKVESSLMIGDIACRVVQEIPRAFVATLHDSILTTELYADPIKAIMREEFARQGLRPTIVTESS